MLVQVISCSVHYLSLSTFKSHGTVSVSAMEKCFFRGRGNFWSKNFSFQRERERETTITNKWKNRRNKSDNIWLISLLQHFLLTSLLQYNLTDFTFTALYYWFHLCNTCFTNFIFATVFYWFHFCKTLLYWFHFWNTSFTDVSFAM